MTIQNILVDGTGAAHTHSHQQKIVEIIFVSMNVRVCVRVFKARVNQEYTLYNVS